MLVKRIWMVDGYNMIHRVPALSHQLEVSLESARHRLVRLCSEWVVRRKDVDRVIIVFDGDASVGNEHADGAVGVRVLYSSKPETADDLILSVIRKGAAGEYDVVSDDHYVARSAVQIGARTTSVSAFHGLLTRPDSRIRAVADAAKTKLSPSEERTINECLKKEWGLR